MVDDDEEKGMAWARSMGHRLAAAAFVARVNKRPGVGVDAQLGAYLVLCTEYTVCVQFVHWGPALGASVAALGAASPSQTRTLCPTLLLMGPRTLVSLGCFVTALYWGAAQHHHHESRGG